MSNIVESLSANWYYDAEIFAVEQKQIFTRNWTFITGCQELNKPGQYVTATIAGQSIVIVRGYDGKLAGFLNLCRHRASMLCADEKGSITRFTCPYHAWSYALDGKLKNAPGFNPGEDLMAENYGLIPVRVDVWNDLVFACLDVHSISLYEWLGDVVRIAENFPQVAEMEFTVMRNNRVRANWKNYSDNSTEGYHLSTIHPALNASMAGRQTRIKPCENGKFVGFDVTYKDGSPGFWIYKFPGLLLHFSMHSFNVERIIPVNEKLTAVQRWFWFASSMGKAQRLEAVEFSSQVMREDAGICARVQKNLEGGTYQTGVLSRQREPGTIFFQQCVREALG